jgi:hypothetical protein
MYSFTASGPETFNYGINYFIILFIIMFRFVYKIEVSSGGDLLSATKPYNIFSLTCKIVIKL